jgi:hypothetical protein
MTLSDQIQELNDMVQELRTDKDTVLDLRTMISYGAAANERM